MVIMIITKEMTMITLIKKVTRKKEKKIKIKRRMTCSKLLQGRRVEMVDSREEDMKNKIMMMTMKKMINLLDL